MASWRSRFARASARLTRGRYRLEAWFITRPGLQLLWSLPALVLVAGVFGVLLFQTTASKLPLIARYQAALSRASAEQDWSSAGLFASKLEALENVSDQGRFAVARLAHQRGDVKAAQRIMAELAPDDDQGYPPAHAWVVQQLLREKQQWKADESGVLIHHLEQLQRSESAEHREMARLLLVDLYVARREYPAAVRCVKSLVDRHPELRLKLAELYRASGEEREFQTVLEEAIRYFRDKLRADSADVSSCFLLARAEVLDGDLAKAEAVLLTGLSATNDPRLCTALSDLYVLMADDLRRSGDEDLGAQFVLLQKAMEYEPRNEKVLLRFARFLQRTGPEAEAARSVLREALADGDAPAIVHLTLGTLAASEGRMEEAELHLEQARQMAPRTPELLNNLAWVFSHADPPDLEQALKMINAALELSPDHPEMRETRGQILALMERWKDALIDLEFALGSLKDRPQLHATLSRIYLQLDEEDMAALHKRRAEKLTAQRKSEEPPSDR